MPRILKGLLCALALHFCTAKAATVCDQIYGYTPSEADIFPLGGGDGQVRFLDWRIIAQEAMRAQPILNACDLMLSDCAPRATLGDGVVDATDIQQALRYSLRYDGAVPDGGGPDAPQAVTPNYQGDLRIQLTRTPHPDFFTLQIDQASFASHGTNFVSMVIGSIRYDVNCLRFVSMEASDVVTNAGLIRFMLQMAPGSPDNSGVQWGSVSLFLQFERLTTNCSSTPHFDESLFPFSAANQNAEPVRVIPVPDLADTMPPLLVGVTPFPLAHGIHFGFQPAPWLTNQVETSVDLIHWTKTANEAVNFDVARFYRLPQK
jgi:hypothetical protein